MLPSGAAPKPSGPLNKAFLICTVSSKAPGAYESTLNTRIIDDVDVLSFLGRLRWPTGILAGDEIPVRNPGGGSFFDQPGRFLRMRDVSRVARTHLDCPGIGALGHLALIFGIDRSVLRSHQIPAGFRLPSRSSNWRCERVLGK